MAPFVVKFDKKGPLKFPGLVFLCKSLWQIMLLDTY